MNRPMTWLTIAVLASLVVRPISAADCTKTSVGLVPVNDLGGGMYLGQFQGGLYPGGSNAVPDAHARWGMMLANRVRPLGTSGQPDPAGKAVLLSIGMSNTTQEFCSQPATEPCDSWTFMGLAAADARVNHTTLVIANGARGGQAASTWDSPADANYDRVRDTVLAPKGLTEAQVQVLWVKQADPQPTAHLPQTNADAYVLESYLGGIARAARIRYPNVKLAFLSSRIYAGYAIGVSTLNPEPYAYESAFSVKWLIAAQIEQMGGGPADPRAGNLDLNTVSPWVGWGPY
ncbi:MAG: hypothetical protein HY718_04560, partial [Planctomycetes bacterium]|nr:hypothetical protein [Planctomycetota bacterium]